MPGNYVPDGWNSLAIRAQGPSVWLLLNDEVIAASTDWTFSSGAVSLVMGREGDPNDDQEVAILLRNLRVSALAEGGPSRVPVYSPSEQPAEPATAPAEPAEE